jgi:hypothetical protein
MKWLKTRTFIRIASAIVLLLAAFGIFEFLKWYRDPQRIALAKGEAIMAKHQAEPVDMTGYVQTSADRFADITSFPAWGFVPTGTQTFDNVPLEIDGMICLYGEGNASKGLTFPEELTGIAINKKFQTLYVYHASFFGSPPGTPVYDIVFRYDDGTSATNKILYGEDVLDWYGHVKPTAARSKVAWRGMADLGKKKQPLQFCLTAVENPYPDTTVTAIDLFSCKSRTAACIHAFTTGKAGLMKVDK